MAMPLATPALIERVEPYWAIEHTSAAAARAARGEPGPLLPEEQHAAPGQLRPSRSAPSPAGCPRRPRPGSGRLGPGDQVGRRRRGSARAGSGRSPWPRGGSSAGARRCAPRAARKALAVRTTVPMLRSCCQFSIATWKSCRRASRSATIASCRQYRYRSTTLRRSPLGEQLRVVPRRPPATGRPTARRRPPTSSSPAATGPCSPPPSAARPDHPRLRAQHATERVQEAALGQADPTGSAAAPPRPGPRR